MGQPLVSMERAILSGMSLSGPTLDSARRLDVRVVLRWMRQRRPLFGCVQVGWSDGCSIGANLTEKALVLDYQADGCTIREELPLDHTPCTYGGSRAWVRCPNCGVRCAVLYATPGSGSRFLCRTCNRRPYGSTRERAPERALRRARTIRARQGDERTELGAVLPLRPRQRLATYERLAAEHDRAVLSFLDSTSERIDRMRKRLDSARR